jgi:hypothetical protein
MILDVFDRDHGSCCIDEDEPPRIEDKGASRENAQLGRIDSIEMRAHGTEPSFRLCLTSLVSLANLCPPLHLGAALLRAELVPENAHGFFSCSVRSFLVVPFQRLRPVHRRIAEVLPGADAKPPSPAVAWQLKKVVEEAAKEEAAGSPG